jgi:hypothetical protein
VIESIEKQLRQPFVRNPRLAGIGERKRIKERDGMGLSDELPSSKMPPEVRIGDWTQRHQEQTEEQEDEKQSVNRYSHYYYFTAYRNYLGTPFDEVLELADIAILIIRLTI